MQPWPGTVLVGHNRHQWPGGDDAVADLDASLLVDHGHRVVRFDRHNDEIEAYGRLATAALAGRVVWSPRAAREVARVVAEERPDLAHFHNVLPLLSPSVLRACRRAGLPVVQTLHDFRLAPCISPFLFRDGGVCEECVGGRVPWAGIRHRCYRDSTAQSAAAAAAVGIHRVLGTWIDAVDVFVALSEFSRDVLLRGGLPPDRVVVRGNFADHVATEPDLTSGTPRDYALYVGRLSAEKGVAALVEAVTGTGVPLKVVGDGPARDEITQLVAGRPEANVELVGAVARRDVAGLMAGARFVVVPSICYENFPVVLAEAFAAGTPAIASRIGGIPGIVDDGRTGVLVSPGDVLALRDAIVAAWSNADETAEMGRRARREHAARMAPEPAYERLIEVYELAIDVRRRRVR